MGGACGSPMTIGGDSQYALAGWGGTPCVRSRRSSRRTRCCDGTGNWWRASGRIQGGQAVVPVFLARFDNSCCARPRKIRRGATREFRVPSRISGTSIGRSTIARVLKAHGVPPAPKRPTSWQTFLRAHWGAIAGADFLTTEVWTWRGLVTFYTVFVIDLATRRVQVVGTTPHPDEAFMRQVVRTLSMADDNVCRVLICDRDAKWSVAVREWLEEAGIRVVQTPYEAPNANAYAERFVRSMKEECLDRIIPIGEGYFRRAVSEFVAHYHRERNHQGLENALIEGAPVSGAGRVHRQSRLGGLLNFYRRAA
ncbi:MAG: hypothetical protein DMG02_01410 [Acidobacteria bacterium]|nr:MAG: hypothetical protein DMG02_01410 [Acidobacteriota bacterium]